MRTQRTLITAVILFIVLLFGATPNARAQENNEPSYKIEGKEIVKVTASKGKKKPVKTDLFYTLKGKRYTVYQGSKGGYFIVRTSKKTQKEYKQYLKVN